MRRLNIFLALLAVGFMPHLTLAEKSKEAVQVKPSSAKTLLIVGDSLTEGYGVGKASAYPAKLEKLFQDNGINVKVQNAGSSGSTTASLKGRLKWHLKKKPDYLMIALGANDGLRGFPIESTKKNLNEGIKLATDNGMKVILAGMLLPMNFGKEYRAQFEAMYRELVKTHEVIFIPFLLKDVGGVKDLNLPDGIHPNEKGYDIVAKTVFEALKGKLK